ncbi:MAG: phosphohistidine phosphatase SixA [Candidatus Binatia bacterium]
MNLYLVRHAIAEDTAPSGRDADRRLSKEGRDKMRRVAEGLKALSVRFDLILTSPYPRAAETAAILGEVLAGIEIRMLPELAAGADIPVLLSALRPYRQVEELALVGHQPDLGLLAAQVLTGSPSLCPVAFKKGSVGCLAIESPRGNLRGELVWLMTPKQLRALAAS